MSVEIVTRLSHARKEGQSVNPTNQEWQINAPLRLLQRVVCIELQSTCVQVKQGRAQGRRVIGREGTPVDGIVMIRLVAQNLEDVGGGMWFKVTSSQSSVFVTKVADLPALAVV